MGINKFRVPKSNAAGDRAFSFRYAIEQADDSFAAALEVLTYHPEPPYNHKVIVENANYVYIVDTEDGDYYKVQFLDYASGAVLLQYMAL
ncbi:MAG: HmuY family protein [Candidatus Neomarinimicrobiota bacterium]